MEKHEFTRTELELDLFNHSANTVYNNETDTFDRDLSLREIKAMNDTDLIDEMMAACSWYGEVEIVIIS